MNAAATTTEQKTDRSILYGAIVIIVGVLATTLAQPQALARIPLQNLLKNELHADRTANAAFFFWAGLAWYFKPFAGILTDSVPLFGSRRKSYILISSILATLTWVAMIFTPHDYRKLLLVVMVIGIFMVVVGGYMVEIAQASAGSGRLTAIRQVAYQAVGIITGPTAGFLAGIAFAWTAAACGGIMFLLVPVTVWFLHEQRQRTDSSMLLGNARKQLVKIGSAKTMWGAAGLMALFYIAPGFSTAVFYRQQNELHMNTQAQGYLVLIAGVFGVIAAVGYGYFCKRLDLRTLLVWCMIAGTMANLGYLFYTSVPRATVVESLNGFGFSLAELALMDLAVRATPKGSEGLGFSLMISVRNLALFGTDWFGSKMLDTYHISFNSLVIANSITTAITIPLVFLLPAVIVSYKDAEVIPEAALPRSVTE